MSITQASELFGKINVYPAQEGKKRVEIYIRLNQKVEKMQVGIAIDGSISMKELYGADIPLDQRVAADNQIEPVVRRLCSFICDYSGDGTVQLIYWAVGDRGKQIEIVETLNRDSSKTLKVTGPQKEKWGTGTLLLPPLEYFLAEFIAAPWTVLLFITDGIMADLDAVKAKATEVAQEMVTGKRGKCKFVIVGLGEEVDEEQLEVLDDMFDGTELGAQGVDLWDCKLAHDIKELQEVWDEVDFGITLPGYARILDPQGQELKVYADTIPQRMEFYAPAEAEFVTVEIAGETIKQPLR
ncbi:MAG: hypothetical protein AB4372_29125 [Xenococcus sp. (in: cyanobacteria)]